MKLSMKHVLLLVATFIFWPCLVHAEDPNTPSGIAVLVARTMREFQGRYKYITDSYHDWGSCGRFDIACGTITPPPLPPDEWYKPELQTLADISQNALDTRAKELVEALLSRFSWGYVWGSPLYWHFVKDRYWDLEGHSVARGEDMYYAAQDFPALRNPEDTDWVEVTTDNYLDVLISLNAYIREKLLVRGLGECIEIGSRGYRVGETTELSLSCESAKAVVNGPCYCPTGDPYNPLCSSWNCDSRQWNVGIGLYGIRETTGSFFWVSKGAGRFKLDSNLTGHSGIAKIYMKIRKRADGWSNLGGLQPWDNKWQLVDTYEPPGQYLSDYFADFEPEFTLDCLEEEQTRGWFLDCEALGSPNHPLKILNWPEFDTSPLGGVQPDQLIEWCTDIHKTQPIVYSANEQCDSCLLGETVKGTITPSTDPTVVMVYLLNAYGSAASLTIQGQTLRDPDRVLCFGNITAANPLNFSVEAHVGSTEISFKVVSYRKSGNTLYHSEETVHLTVTPNSGGPCCRQDEDDDGPQHCPLLNAIAGNASAFINCGLQPALDGFELTEHANGDIEGQLPGYLESYILSGAGPGFLSGFTFEAVRDANDLTSFSALEHSAGLAYNYTPVGTVFRLTSIRDFATPPNTLVRFEYENGRLRFQYDGETDPPTHYIEYIYHGTTGHLESLKVHTPEGVRIFTIHKDAAGRVTRVTGGAGGGGGCSGCEVSDLIYSFNAGGKIHQIKIMDDQSNEVVLWEYTYDSDGKFTGKLQGAGGNPFKLVNRRQDGDTLIVDKYTFGDSGASQVVREHYNSAGLVTRRQTFAGLNEDPDNPRDEVFTEITKYEYDPATDLLTKSIVIPPLGDPSGEGIRIERHYDPATGALLEESRYDGFDNKSVLRKITYDNVLSGGVVVHVRVKTETDARGAVTTYDYDGSSPLVKTKKMPLVTDGLTGTKQLSYEYTYDDQNRVWEELTRDCSDTQNVVTLLTTEYRYDDFGRLDKQTVTDNKANPPVTMTTRYLYDGFGQLKWTISADGVVSGKTYDDGRLASDFVLANPGDLAVTGDRIDDSQVNYQTLELISQTRYHYGLAHDIGSNNYVRGRLQYVKQVKEDSRFIFAEAEDPSVTWVTTEYRYDPYGRRTSVVADAGGASLETLYEYDVAGRIIKTTLPSGKWTETFRDGRGLVRMQVVGHDNVPQNEWPVTLFYYDARGSLSERIDPDGGRTIYKYDDFGRLTMTRKTASN